MRDHTFELTTNLRTEESTLTIDGKTVHPTSMTCDIDADAGLCEINLTFKRQIDRKPSPTWYFIYSDEMGYYAGTNSFLWSSDPLKAARYITRDEAVAVCQRDLGISSVDHVFSMERF